MQQRRQFPGAPNKERSKRRGAGDGARDGESQQERSGEGKRGEGFYQCLNGGGGCKSCNVAIKKCMEGVLRKSSFQFKRR